MVRGRDQLTGVVEDRGRNGFSVRRNEEKKRKMKLWSRGATRGKENGGRCWHVGLEEKQLGFLSFFGFVLFGGFSCRLPSKEKEKRRRVWVNSRARGAWVCGSCFDFNFLLSWIFDCWIGVRFLGFEIGR